MVTSFVEKLINIKINMLNAESNELSSIYFCRIEIEQLLIWNLLILIKFINSVKVIKDRDYSKHILQKKVFDTFFLLLIITMIWLLQGWIKKYQNMTIEEKKQSPTTTFWYAADRSKICC